MDYTNMITRFLYEAVPLPSVSAEVKFEALAAEVFGTKQQRFGGMPTPEVQVQVRDVLRRDGPIEFLIPWGASKQQDVMNLDVAEFCALKQLRCLVESLRRYGKEAVFTFRIEDLTDLYLFGKGRKEQIDKYVDDLTRLIHLFLPEAQPRLESFFTDDYSFQKMAGSMAPIFYKYLIGETPIASLKELGWKGEIPLAQREYYLKQYALFYPGGNHLFELAKYFAATLTRVRQGAVCAPKNPFILIAFTHPVPENPINTPRIYYRTMPEKHTNTHKSPWLSKGVFRMGDYTVTPRFHQGETLVRNTIKYDGIEIDADYFVGD